MNKKIRNNVVLKVNDILCMNAGWLKYNKYRSLAIDIKIQYEGELVSCK